MNTEYAKLSENLEIMIYSISQHIYDDYRLKNDLPQQPVQFATKEEKEAICHDHG